MFELLSNVESLPISLDSIVRVQRGMNKVRVSVGEHSSEPSEVYIITGRSNEKLESYIIFFMLEPAIHVVYGWDQNPYAPEQEEQIMDVSVNFVEDLGSILQVIPWETMTPDQKSDWIENENLYSVPIIEDIEEIEEIKSVEIEEIDDEAMMGAGIEEELAIDQVEDLIEVNEEELQQTQLESSDGEDTVEEGPVDESYPVSEEIEEELVEVEMEPDEIVDGNVDTLDDEENDVDGVDTPDMKDVVIAEGDFDELLKQAFLKPDVAEKTKRKAVKKETEKVKEEQPVPEGSSPEKFAGDELADDAMDVVEEVVETIGAGESAEVEKEKLEIPGEPEVPIHVESDIPLQKRVVEEVENSPEANDSVPFKRDIRLKVVRFLSRF